MDKRDITASKDPLLNIEANPGPVAGRTTPKLQNQANSVELVSSQVAISDGAKRRPSESRRVSQTFRPIGAATTSQATQPRRDRERSLSVKREEYEHVLLRRGSEDDELVDFDQKGEEDAGSLVTRAPAHPRAFFVQHEMEYDVEPTPPQTPIFGDAHTSLSAIHTARFANEVPLEELDFPEPMELKRGTSETADDLSAEPASPQGSSSASSGSAMLDGQRLSVTSQIAHDLSAEPVLPHADQRQRADDVPAEVVAPETPLPATSISALFESQRLRAIGSLATAFVSNTCLNVLVLDLALHVFKVHLPVNLLIPSLIIQGLSYAVQNSDHGIEERMQRAFRHAGQFSLGLGAVTLVSQTKVSLLARVISGGVIGGLYRYGAASLDLVGRSFSRVFCRASRRRAHVE